MRTSALPRHSEPPDGRDARMTAHRRETKHLVTGEQARVIAAAVAAHLTPHRYAGPGASALPGAHHYVTTIYFDTPSRALFRAARASAAQHLKLRAKEYYDLHPDLTETATDPRQLVRYQPILWLELKEKDGAHTGKRRIGIPKVDVPAFFALGRVTAEMVRIQEDAFGAAGRSVLEAVAALCAGCAEPLHADSLVNYRRTAWQDDGGELRVTIDSKLTFYAPPRDLWTRGWALVRETLGPPRGADSRRVLEIKSHGEPPRWLVDALAAARVEPVAFSKFEVAAGAVHG